MPKTTVCQKVYIDSNGEEHRSVPDSCAAIEFRFSNGENRRMTPADFPESIQAAFPWHGLSQKLGDSYSGAKGDPAIALQSFTESLDTLLEGQWVTAREGGGPRVSQLAQAMFNVAVAAGKDDVSIESLVAQLKGYDDDRRKAVMEHPKVNAELKAIQAKAAAERAAEAAKAAANDETSIDDLLAG